MTSAEPKRTSAYRIEYKVQGIYKVPVRGTLARAPGGTARSK